MLAKTRIKKVLLLFLFTLIVTLTLAELITLTNCASPALTPTVNVMPNRVSLNQNITLVVKIEVKEESSVSATSPVISGYGDAVLLSEAQQLSMIVQPGDVAEFRWIYDATQLGAIKFSLALSVKETRDDSVVFSQSLESTEIGISRGSAAFLAGLGILSVYVLLAIWYEEPYEPPSEEERQVFNIRKTSTFHMMGGLRGIGVMLIILCIGVLFGVLSKYGGLPSLPLIGVLGFSLAALGLGLCKYDNNCHREFREETARHLRKLEKTVTSKEPEIQQSTFKERGTPFGLSSTGVVVIGLSGFFGVWEAWTGIFVLIVLGIIPIGKVLFIKNTL